MSKHQISTQEDSMINLVDRSAVSRQTGASLCPRLTCKVSFYAEKIVFVRDDYHLTMKIEHQSSAAWQKIFLMMDGTLSLPELQQRFSTQNPQIISTLVKNLEQQGLIEDAAQFQTYSGVDTILELAEFTAKFRTKDPAQVSLWQQIASADLGVATQVVFGLMIEYYHFFSQQFAFDSAVLGFSGASKIRQLVNQHYCQEFGQADILLKALKTIGITQADLIKAIPLPQNTAICHALSYWASFEPIFFLTTLELVRKETLDNFCSCLKAGSQLQLESSFLEPIKQLVDTKLNRKTKHLTQLIFQEIHHIEKIERQRYLGQTQLLLEMYATFYRAIWSHYSSTPNLWRSIESI